jgi:hypothetical protein
MIRNVQFLNVYDSRSTFALDSDFVKINFEGESIKPLFVLKNTYLISIVR